MLFKDPLFSESNQPWNNLNYVTEESVVSKSD